MFVPMMHWLPQNLRETLCRICAGVLRIQTTSVRDADGLVSPALMFALDLVDGRQRLPDEYGCLAVGSEAIGPMRTVMPTERSMRNNEVAMAGSSVFALDGGKDSVQAGQSMRIA